MNTTKIVGLLLPSTFWLGIASEKGLLTSMETIVNRPGAQQRDGERDGLGID